MSPRLNVLTMKHLSEHNIIVIKQCIPISKGAKYCTSNSSKNDTTIITPNDKLSKKNAPKKRKLPEVPEECCMTGCPNCVWLEYAEELTKYFQDGGEKATQEINEKVSDPQIKAFILNEIKMKNRK